MKPDCMVRLKIGAYSLRGLIYSPAYGERAYRVALLNPPPRGIAFPVDARMDDGDMSHEVRVHQTTRGCPQALAVVML